MCSAEFALTMDLVVVWAIFGVRSLATSWHPLNIFVGDFDCSCFMTHSFTRSVSPLPSQPRITFLVVISVFHDKINFCCARLSNDVVWPPPRALSPRWPLPEKTKFKFNEAWHLPCRSQESSACIYRNIVGESVIHIKNHKTVPLRSVCPDTRRI